MNNFLNWLILFTFLVSAIPAQRVHAYDHHTDHVHQFKTHQCSHDHVKHEDHDEHSSSEERHCNIHCSSCCYIFIKRDFPKGEFLRIPTSNKVSALKKQLYRNPYLSLPFRPPITVS